jgi:hypothetical protein
MGRELKRVPLDFDWPNDQVWKGYINPYHSMPCKSCGGSGLNPETEKLNESWYSSDDTEWVWLEKGKKRFNNKAWQYHLTQDEVLALIKEGRLMDFTHNPRNDEQLKIVKEKVKNGGNSWLPKSNGYIPTAEEVNEWAKIGMGHDSINRWICVEARAKRLGFYGKCKYCKGDGELWHSDEIKKLSEDWEDFEPPKGEGFQLWETTSEGSPISPVFNALDELCEWAADNTTTFGRSKATKEEWSNMLNNDFVCHKEGNMVFI